MTLGEHEQIFTEQEGLHNLELVTGYSDMSVNIEGTFGMNPQEMEEDGLLVELVHVIPCHDDSPTNSEISMFAGEGAGKEKVKGISNDGVTNDGAQYTTAPKSALVGCPTREVILRELVQSLKEACQRKRD
ncbi:Hypothetical predicted protein [Prunus dulcis]|uniref:Uncharacterized protein n=1 Tax=Prunus dulcis TaxID=3755 RepID=A0A5E4GK97_PRUDU|nr:Hypothetical predicted protein [Prunus dulcis]